MKCPHCNKNGSWHQAIYLEAFWQSTFLQRDYSWTTEVIEEHFVREFGFPVFFCQRVGYIHEIYICVHCGETVS